MPITEKEMALADMERAEKEGHLCAKCQGRLTVAWGGAFGINSHILRCSKDIKHSGITRHDKKYEQKKREVFSMETTALQAMDEQKMLQRVEMARFPQELTRQDKALLAQVAITYGFDPLMGEVTIYQARPYVSIDGRYRKAQETGQLDGVDTRPATKQEREDWGIPDGDYFFRSEVYVKGSGHPFVAWGRVYSSETKPGSRKPGDTTSTFKPVQSNPQRMAEKRAEAQALRKAFHIPLPSVEDIGSSEYGMESAAIEVDKTTGEITEPKEQSQAKGEHKEKPQAQKTAVADEPEPEEPQEMPPDGMREASRPEKEQTSVIDSVWLKESLEALQWTTCVKWLNDRFKTNGRRVSEIVAELTREQAEEFVKEVEDRLQMM